MCPCILSCTRAIRKWGLYGGRQGLTGVTSCQKSRSSKASSLSRWASRVFFHTSHMLLDIHITCMSQNINCKAFLLPFCSFQKLQFTLSDCSSAHSAPPMPSLTPEELHRQLEQLLLEDLASDEQIFDWVEVKLATQTYQFPLQNLLSSLFAKCYNALNPSPQKVSVCHRKNT